MRAFIFCGLLFFANLAPAAEVAPNGANPAATGFDSAGSDARAVAIADATMAAMGGRAAWDKTRFLVWRFFGSRLHIWDRYTGRERMEFVDKKTGQHRVVLLDLNKKDARLFVDGKEVTDAAQRSAAAQHGYEAWINDSYWLLMPYKLKDSGVTLKYKGVAPLPDGRPADVVILTFAGVGVTPQNKYDVYVAKNTNLVEQWSYYEKSTDPAPEFSTPWVGWKRCGSILLSGDRGKDGQLTDIAAPAQIADAVFTNPAPVDLSTLVAPAH